AEQHSFQAFMMASEERSIDWRQVTVWAVLLTVSVFAHAYVEVASEARRGVSLPFGRAVAIEVASHLVVAALLPVFFWRHQLWPPRGPPRNLAIHVLAIVPFSVVHTVGMAALRLVWFAGIPGGASNFPATFYRL